MQFRVGILTFLEFLSFIPPLANICLAGSNQMTLVTNFPKEASQSCSSTNISHAYCLDDYSMAVSFAYFALSLCSFSNLIIAMMQLDKISKIADGSGAAHETVTNALLVTSKIFTKRLFVNVPLQLIKTGVLIGSIWLTLNNIKFNSAASLPASLQDNEKYIQNINYYANPVLIGISTFLSLYWIYKNHQAQKANAAVPPALNTAGADVSQPEPYSPGPSSPVATDSAAASVAGAAGAGAVGSTTVPIRGWN